MFARTVSKFGVVAALLRGDNNTSRDASGFAAGVQLRMNDDRNQNAMEEQHGDFEIYAADEASRNHIKQGTWEQLKAWRCKFLEPVSEGDDCYWMSKVMDPSSEAVQKQKHKFEGCPVCLTDAGKWEHGELMLQVYNSKTKFYHYYDKACFLENIKNLPLEPVAGQVDEWKMPNNLWGMGKLIFTKAELDAIGAKTSSEELEFAGDVDQYSDDSEIAWERAEDARIRRVHKIQSFIEWVVLPAIIVYCLWWVYTDYLKQ